MNIVFLSGKIISVEEMEQDVMLGVIEDDEQFYFVFWEKKDFANYVLLDRKVMTRANIKRIKIKTDDKVKRVIAYKLKEVEIINDI